jgi:hypothetical protein
MSSWLLQPLPCPKKTKKKIETLIEKECIKTWLPFAMASRYHSREENMYDFRYWDAPWWVMGDKSSPVAGTSQRIILVNVGHKISPQKAVQITASLSLARVPGPVQQADLYGRELMRKRSSS